MSALSLRLRPARPRWQRARGETKADGDKLADAAGYASGLATNLLWLRRHGEARTAADRYLILGPTNPEAYQLRAMVALAQGKLNEAPAVLRRGEARVPKDELLAFVAYYWDLFWLLDADQRARVLNLKPEAFHGDTLWWQIVQAGTHLFNGDSSRASKVAEQARHRATLLVARDSTRADAASRLGLANAYFGRGEEAGEAAQTSLAHLPVAKDAMVGALLIYRLACVQALAGEKQAAVGTLETLLSIPFLCIACVATNRSQLRFAAGRFGLQPTDRTERSLARASKPGTPCGLGLVRV